MSRAWHSSCGRGMQGMGVESAAQRRFLCHKLHKLIISAGPLLLLLGLLRIIQSAQGVSNAAKHYDAIPL